MHERKGIAQELAEIELAAKELEIHYEQYFAGVEKLEPIQDRTNLARRLRQFANRRIVQTDLRFRYQSLATRFHSYCGYWDRILRLMDEGRYIRQKGAGQRPKLPAEAAVAEAPPAREDEVDLVYRDLLAAHRACNLQGTAPERSKVAAFLEQQKEKIREKFGDQAVVFRVELEGGKPRIKVRAKQ